MPVRRLFAAVLFAASTSSTAVSAQDASRAAQAGRDPRMAMRAVSQEAMKPLAWLVGEWEGPATAEYAPGRNVTLTQRETVVWGAFNTAILVQGRGRFSVGDSSRLVYDAAALIAYDALTKKFVMAASGGSGIAGSFDIKVDGSNITWGFPLGDNERVRYDISLTPDGKWKEIGYESKDGGKTWTKNLEMLLSRKP